MKNCLVFGCVALGLSCAVTATQNPQAYPASRVMQPPVVDGRLDDEVWKAAPLITDLLSNKRQPAKFATEFRLVDDGEAIYVSVLARKPDISRLKCRDEADAPHKMWNDDCIEIFLDPQATRQRYYQYIVNASGLIACSYCGDFSVDLFAEAAAGRTEDAWTLEVRIPFSTFGAAPAPGERWGMNLTRGREPKAQGERRENSLWCPTDSNHGNPGRFGYLVFGGLTDDLPPSAEPDMEVVNRVLDQVRKELAGQWAWSEADVCFEARNERARRLVSLIGVLARFPNTQVLYSVYPAIRDDQVMPWSVPDTSELGGGLNLVACRGEFESVRLALLATRPL
ncbi:MAG: sugar-binding protein [Phycisphaerae bacterium]